MTRAELQAAAETLARELGRTVEPNLSRARLEAVIGEMRGTEPPSVDGNASTSSGSTPSKPEARPAKYAVAPGKATIAAGKVVGPGTLVNVSDFECGQTDIEFLLGRGVLIKK